MKKSSTHPARLSNTLTASAIMFSLAVCPTLLTANSEALRDYVERPDPVFSFEKEAAHELDSVQAHVLRLTSQEWRGIEWQHRLTVLVPASVRHPEAAVLLVAGGSNQNERPQDFTDHYSLLAAQIAHESGVAFAILEHVPNQPLMGGLNEDDLIALTFSRTLETNEWDWPLLFPMVKSTTRAMDAVTQYLEQELGSGPREFIVTGASKRGWTTWLTAAVDPRVKAIAPMVFDILNFNPQLELQRASFDGYSEMIRAYEEQNLFALLSTEAGAALGQAVDPFTYRTDLQMPKLILLGTNDPYWSVDAAGLYFNELNGPKHLYYLPNAGHRLGMGIAPTLRAFVRQTLADEPMPRLKWARPEPHKLVASWDRPGGEARLWTAHSLTRDFQEATWTSQPLNGENQQTQVTLPAPEEGFTARYIEVEFPFGGDRYGLTTEIVVSEAPALGDRVR